MLADAGAKAAISFNAPIVHENTEKLLVKYNALGQAVKNQNYSEANTTLKEVRSAIVFLNEAAERERKKDNKKGLNKDLKAKYNTQCNRDIKNIGRKINPETGEFLYKQFGYPTYYVSDTHHLVLANKVNQSEFSINPNHGFINYPLNKRSRHQNQKGSMMELSSKRWNIN
jgi:hypothetical protein